MRSMASVAGSGTAARDRPEGANQGARQASAGRPTINGGAEDGGATAMVGTADSRREVGAGRDRVHVPRKRHLAADVNTYFVFSSKFRKCTKGSLRGG